MRFSNALIFCGLIVLMAGCATSPEVSSQSPEAAVPAPEAVAPVQEVVSPAPEAVAPVEKKTVSPHRQRVTPEQRAKFREQREKYLAERKAKMEARMLEVAKKSVPEEEQAKALVKELDESIMSPRRSIRRPPVKLTESASTRQQKTDHPEVAAVGKEAVQSPQVTREQLIDERRAKAEQRRAERRAAVEARFWEITKKYIPDEEKSRTLAKDLLDVMLAEGRSMMR